jgi:hypothetical protein
MLVNRWVAAAVHAITAENVRNSWQHTLLRPFPLLMLQSSVFAIIVSYLGSPREKLIVAMISAHYKRKDWTRRSTPTAVQLSRKRERAASNVEEREDGNRRASVLDDAAAACG